MNCSPPHSLTVKYLGSLSAIILMCVFDSAGVNQAALPLDRLLIAFCMFCC